MILSYRTRLAATAMSLVLFLMAPANAVMPPAAEARAALARINSAAAQRDAATHVLRMQVLKVHVQRIEGDHCPSVESWNVDARVVSTTRGTLSSGQAIQLQYAVEHYRCPGPVQESWPALQQGEDIAAFLDCNGSHCQPAAGPMSFLSEVDFAQERSRREAEVQRYAPAQPAEPAY